MSKKDNNVKVNYYDVISKPIVTEKSQIQSTLNKYYFDVAVSADKDIVKKAIEAIFSVNVTKINIINRKGKTKRFKGTLGKRKDIKRAIVTLKDGETIDAAGFQAA